MRITLTASDGTALEDFEVVTEFEDDEVPLATAIRDFIEDRWETREVDDG